MGQSQKDIGRVVGEKIATVFGLWELLSDPHLLLKEIGLVNNKVYNQIPSNCYA